MFPPRRVSTHARTVAWARVADDGQKLPVDLDQLQRVLGEIALAATTKRPARRR